MTDAVKDLAPVIASMADLETLARAHPGRPVVLYITGRHTDGTLCPRCQEFDEQQRPTLQAHQQGTVFAQTEVQLSIGGFNGLAARFGGRLDPQTKIFTTDGVSYPAGTPTLLRFESDANGKLHATAVAGDAVAEPGTLDQWLQEGEQEAARARVGAAGLDKTGVSGPQVASRGEFPPLQPAPGVRSDAKLGLG